MSLHNKPGMNLEAALSYSNMTNLTYQINNAHSALSLKCSNLINEALASNYPQFIKQLESSLDGLKLSFQEKEAIGIVLTRMKEYQAHTDSANRIQSQINSAVMTISSETEKLQKANARLQLLKQANPGLTRANEALVEENTKLEQAHNENKQSRNKFGLLTGVFAGVAAVTGIPLVLALTGVIAVALAPVIFYTLISILPALALAATIGLGITALVFAVKAATNQKNAVSNENVIAANNQKMISNTNEIKTIEDVTLPKCLELISTNSLLKSQYIKARDEKQALANNALQLAQSTEPNQALYPVIAQAYYSDDVPPPYYSVSNGHSFFDSSTLFKPSAPPLELPEESSSHSYH